jgi:hypothetical protein
VALKILNLPLKAPLENFFIREGIFYCIDSNGLWRFTDRANGSSKFFQKIFSPQKNSVAKDSAASKENNHVFVL